MRIDWFVLTACVLVFGLGAAVCRYGSDPVSLVGFSIAALVITVSVART